ncbi:MAG: hypothetical protein AAGE94_08575 [Acidobacteriota bacterium]
MTRRRALLDPGLVLVAWILAGPLGAQPLAPAPDSARAPGVDLVAPCAGGIVSDDATVETGWGWVPSAVEGTYLQEYAVADLPTRGFSSVCACWLRTRADDSIDFEIVAYAAVDGLPAEAPFAAVPARAEGLPLGVVGAFTEVPVAIEFPDTVEPDGTIFVGVRWNPSVDQFFFVCADTTPTAEPTRVWFRDDRATGWDNTETTRDPLFLDHSAILLRPVPRAPFEIEVPVLGWAGTAVLAAALALAGLLWLRR